LLTAFLSILRDVLPLSKTCKPVNSVVHTKQICSLSDHAMTNHADENAFNMKRV
jgi:hypothetical protein